MENKKIDVNVIKKHCKELSKKFDYVLIEGAGGLIVPLTRDYSVLNLVQDLSVPVLIIARAGLGTINHTSLTLTALKQRKIPAIGIIMNYFKGSVIEEDNKKIIFQLNGVPIIGAVPFSRDIKSLTDNFEEYIDLKNLFSTNFSTFFVN